MTSTATSPRVPAAGEPAPDLALPSTSGETVRLADLRGREHVLLAFFPLAFTSTCTAEMCAFTDDYNAFAGRGVRVLPISVDSVPTLNEFRAKYDPRNVFRVNQNIAPAPAVGGAYPSISTALPAGARSRPT